MKFANWIKLGSFVLLNLDCIIRYIYIVIYLSVRSFCVFIELLIKPRFLIKVLLILLKCFWLYTFESQKRHKFMLFFTFTTFQVLLSRRIVTQPQFSLQRQDYGSVCLAIWNLNRSTQILRFSTDSHVSVWFPVRHQMSMNKQITAIDPRTCINIHVTNYCNAQL